ncbi:hypothetical protein [Streptomyces himalayensis]|uniref:Uncharacterized protein n=1 Tax=Streptomyces himalayensis subsp. himalayensis TaxID=2756131 RepID=A0A7W0DX34_9ACTN|nr:hypothetical protein [Streptomyces himalayensis]MBA2952029.1 hypothetical protein [Streptomyces himalayensis subsp. himalayensis]
MADARVSLPPLAPEGLSRRARYFVEVHGLRVPRPDIRPHRDVWLRDGIPAAEIDRVVAFQDRWGGIVLPPAPVYEGGPRILNADVPEGSAADGWLIPAGDERVSMAYEFMIGPEGEFGIHADRWTPLHASTEGWVESLALAHHAGHWAKSITKIKGDAVEALQLDGYDPIPEVQGLTDTWWRGKDSLIAIYRGEALGLAAPQCREAHIYGGIDDWGLRGG